MEKLSSRSASPTLLVKTEPARRSACQTERMGSNPTENQIPVGARRSVRGLMVAGAILALGLFFLPERAPDSEPTPSDSPAGVEVSSSPGPPRVPWSREDRMALVKRIERVRVEVDEVKITIYEKQEHRQFSGVLGIGALKAVPTEEAAPIYPGPSGSRRQLAGSDASHP